MLMYVIAHRGCMDTIREPALKIDWEKKSLVTLGNQTCLSSMLVWHSTSWATCPPQFGGCVICPTILMKVVYAESVHFSVLFLRRLVNLVLHQSLDLKWKQSLLLFLSTWIINVCVCFRRDVCCCFVYGIFTCKHWITLFNKWNVCVHLYADF